MKLKKAAQITASPGERTLATDRRATLTSVPGAIVGGLIAGAGEKIAEAYLGPYLGGGIEYWFAYVLALVVLLMRPQGLFGERIIERV